MKLVFRAIGFTLIELLIVVAIIGILAAIAIPNFLQAQVRAKVARVQNDMRSTATALETYRVDIGKYPPGFTHWDIYTGNSTLPTDPLIFLTSPVDYLSSVPRDPFFLDDIYQADPGPGPLSLLGNSGYGSQLWFKCRAYQKSRLETGRSWALMENMAELFGRSSISMRSTGLIMIPQMGL